MIAEFRVFPRDERTGLYYGVQVFESKEKMIAYCKRHCCYSPPKSLVAVCHSFVCEEHPKRGKKRVSRHMGDIHFFGSPQADVVAHECTHAGLFWIKRISRSQISNYSRFKLAKEFFLEEKDGAPVDGYEELLCEAVGNLYAWTSLGLHLSGIWG
jgi:hypothetical protein